MAKNALDIRVKLPSDAELKKMFDAVPQLKRHAVMKTTTTAAAKVITQRAKQLAPRGTKADAAKRSKKQRSEANWNVKLRTTVAQVTRTYDNGSFSVVGPKSPNGNKAYMNQPRTRSRLHKLWGKDVGRTYKAARSWIVAAFDETRSQQLSAMKTALSKKIDEMMK
jgi:hypothetical protein